MRQSSLQADNLGLAGFLLTALLVLPYTSPSHLERDPSFRSRRRLRLASRSFLRCGTAPCSTFRIAKATILSRCGLRHETPVMKAAL